MGNSGKTSSVDTDWPHPVMLSYSHTEVGAIILNIKDNRLDASFYTANNTIYDHFTIVKSHLNAQTVDVCIGEAINLQGSWESEPSIWNPGNIQQNTYQITALANATIVRTDALGCIPDTFNIVVHENDTCGYLSFIENEIEQSAFNAYFLDGFLVIENYLEGSNNFELYTTNGQMVAQLNMNKGILKTDLRMLPKGIYFLKPEFVSKSKRILKID